MADGDDRFELAHVGDHRGRDGIVCAIAFSGTDRGAQWPGSRVISAQKANTANTFGLDSSSSSARPGMPGLALSTANLYFGRATWRQPVWPAGEQSGGDPQMPTRDHPTNFGQSNDPLVGEKVGGVNVFGGGSLRARLGAGKIVGGVGVSGDTSCADHNIAWRVRQWSSSGLPGVIPGAASPLCGRCDASRQHHL